MHAGLLNGYKVPSITYICKTYIYIIKMHRIDCITIFCTIAQVALVSRSLSHRDISTVKAYYVKLFPGQLSNVGFPM